jgi:hypothetical protein
VDIIKKFDWAMLEADEISDEDLEAAGYMYDVLAAEGWEGWLRRNEEAMKHLGHGTEGLEMTRMVVGRRMPCEYE